MTTTFSIGQLAKQAQVGIETIRYYERRGLLPDPPRRASGYRQYTPDSVSRLKFILHGKQLGFSLTEIAELLTLRVDPDTTCSQVRNRAEAKISDVHGKIQALLQIERALTKLVAECQGRGPTSECPILDALETDAGISITKP